MTDALYEEAPGPTAPIQTDAGRVDVTNEQLAEACQQRGIRLVTTATAEPQNSFRPAMELGWSDCDPVATCHCGARLKGDSINDALVAWGKHVTTVHRGEW